MTFTWIDQHRQTWSVTLLCHTLGVSRAGYYAWRARKPSATAKRRDQLVTQITAVHTEMKGRYGSPRIHAELVACGVPCSENTIARLMKAHEIRAKSVQRSVRTTDSNHRQSVAENRLDRLARYPDIRTRPI